MRTLLIHMLGGYTRKEYNQVVAQRQALIDSKNTDETLALIINEYQYRLLTVLYNYTKLIYGIGASLWCKKVYNLIRNNWLRMNVRYISVGSKSIFSFDNTLDEEDSYLRLLKSEGINIEEE